MKWKRSLSIWPNWSLTDQSGGGPKLSSALAYTYNSSLGAVETLFQVAELQYPRIGKIHHDLKP
jgi:hypothetical protein